MLDDSSAIRISLPTCLISCVQSNLRAGKNSIKMIVRKKVKPHIAVVYTHFPRYRQPVFNALTQNATYKYTFYYDPAGINNTIMTGTAAKNHKRMVVKTWRGFMWQSGAVALAKDPEIDGIIFLGNPFILSTWVAAIVARLYQKAVFFWTHGWLKQEAGIKAWVRAAFYKLANGLLVYGHRARQIGEAKGFDPNKIHVVSNSLDYTAQKLAREKTLAMNKKDNPFKNLPEKPFFLCVSRLVDSVELDKAVEAISRIPVDTALIVVGAGPKLKSLQELAMSLGVDVCFLGEIYDESQLAWLFLEACAVVSPGKIGLLAIHALAYGTPVITHDDLDRQMPEVEVISEGLTGAFFKHGDVADLAEKMTKFLLDKNKEVRRDQAIARIEAAYTPEAQVAFITSALKNKLEGKC